MPNIRQIAWRRGNRRSLHWAEGTRNGSARSTSGEQEAPCGFPYGTEREREPRPLIPCGARHAEQRQADHAGTCRTERTFRPMKLHFVTSYTMNFLPHDGDPPGQGILTVRGWQAYHHEYGRRLLRSSPAQYVRNVPPLGDVGTFSSI